MAYLQTSDKWLIDRENWEFVEAISLLGKKEDIEVPFFFWNHGGKDTVTTKTVFGQPGNRYQRVYNMKLNGFSVKFNISCDDVKLVLPNKTFTVRTDSELAPSFGSAGGMRLLGVGFKFITDDKTTAFTHYFDGRDYISAWGLYISRYENIALSYGISSLKFDVYFLGTQLKGKRHVFFIGAWCILLDDKFHFEAIGIFKEIHGLDVRLDKIIYTENPYIVKVVTLAQR